MEVVLPDPHEVEAVEARERHWLVDEAEALPYQAREGPHCLVRRRGREGPHSPAPGAGQEGPHSQHPEVEPLGVQDVELMCKQSEAPVAPLEWWARRPPSVSAEARLAR